MIVDYRRKRIRHLLRLNDIRVPKLMCKYIPNGTRNIQSSTLTLEAVTQGEIRLLEVYGQ